jgi:hypothetical protein
MIILLPEMNFLRNFFGLGKKEEIEFNRIDEWLDNYSENEFKELKETIADLYDKIDEKKSTIHEKLKELKDANIDGKFSLREIQFMHGNRDAYTKKINLFLESIQMPEKSKHKEIIEYYDLFESDLDEFGKYTIKSYSILREFFEKIMSDIAREIKEIEKTIKEIADRTDDSKIIEIERIKNKIHAVRNAIKTKEKMHNEIKEKKKAMKELKERKEKTEKELEKYRKGNDYLSYHILLKEKNELAENIRREKDSVLQLFSGLDKALKKYKRDSLNEGLIDLYLNDPNKAIFEDKIFEIIDVLDKLKKLVEDEKIELDERKKEKTLQVIDSLNQDILKDKRNKIEELVEKRKDKELQIEKSSVMTNYKDIEYRLDHVKNKINDEESSINKLEHNRDKIDEDELKKELEKEINSIVKKRIKII